MLVLVIFGYVQLFEATTRVGELQSQLNELTAQQTLLESKYESKIDLKVVQQRAEELGMSAPRDDQVIYVSLSGSDRAEIYEEEKTNILGEIIGAVEESISDLIAYLRPSAA
jgi:ferritin-like protein